MSKASEYADRVAKGEVGQRPIYLVDTPSGPVVAAFIDAAQNGSPDSRVPVLVLREQVWTLEGFSGLIGWAGEQFNRQGKE